MEEFVTTWANRHSGLRDRADWFEILDPTSPAF